MTPLRALPFLLFVLTGCDVPTPPPTLMLSEFMASNTVTLTDDLGGTPDWIELHNPGSEPVSLAGFYLSDDGGRPDRTALAEDAEVAPGGYALFFASGTVDDDPQTLPFRLSASGEELLLSYDAGDGAEPLDATEYGPQTSDVSLARDADGDWVEDDSPTPGGPND